jgi:hypothetical protein
VSIQTQRLINEIINSAASTRSPYALNNVKASKRVEALKQELTTIIEALEKQHG